MGRRVLIIVENLTMPLDRRVWQEATTLRDAGHTVSIICPVGGQYIAPYELLEGIHVFRHPLPLEASGALGYLVEYITALFWEAWLSLNVLHKVGFDLIQACNPPDTIFLIAGFYRFFGKPFIFDHHDINPELYEAKFGKRGFFHRLLTMFERWTFRTADVSIATNATFKRIAVERGGMDANRVFIVRSIPDLKRFRRIDPDTALRKGRKTLLGYVGIMGAQDGVDLLVEAMVDIVHRRGRKDVQCAVIGSGTELETLKRLAIARNVSEYVTFTGFRSGDALLGAFSAFDIGVIPDPKNIYNDKISMNKVFEYMTLGLPFVAFDLEETRRTAGNAGLYAGTANSPRELADNLLLLADDSALRQLMGGIGKARASAELVWDRERDQLLAAYELAFATPASQVVPVQQSVSAR